MIDKEISKLTEGVMQNVNQRYQREWKVVYHSELHDVDFTLFLDKMMFNTMALILLMIIPLSLRIFQSELYQLVIEHQIPNLRMPGRIMIFLFGILLLCFGSYLIRMRFQSRPHIVGDHLTYKKKTYHSSELSWSSHAGKRVSIYANGKRLFTASADYINYGSLNAWVAKCNIALRKK